MPYEVIQILESWKFLLVKSRALESISWNPESHERLESGLQNPLPMNPESTTWNREFKTLKLPHMGQNSSLPCGRCSYFVGKDQLQAPLKQLSGRLAKEQRVKIKMIKSTVNLVFHMLLHIRFSPVAVMNLGYQ